jgi:hypothetical protein
LIIYALTVETRCPEILSIFFGNDGVYIFPFFLLYTCARTPHSTLRMTAQPAPAIPAAGPASSGLQLKLGGWYGIGVRAPRRFERSHAPFTAGSRACLFPPPPRRPSSLRSHFPARLASSGLGSPPSPRSQLRRQSIAAATDLR